jgi:hypothetical protein
VIFEKVLRNIIPSNDQDHYRFSNENFCLPQPTWLFLNMPEIPITNEQEAAVAILFASVMANGKSLNQSQIEQLSRMLVLSSKFKTDVLNELTVKALSLQAVHGSREIIEHAAPIVSDDFRETLFAMCCEVMTSEGRINEEESEVLAMVALYLGLSIENMKMMLTTYLIRNRWNVQIIEQQ